MKLSTESRYAVVGLAFLASRPGAILEVAQVAEGANLPAPFLAKIFGKLSHRGIIRSHRGKERGYSLARAAADISMKEILEAVDGADIFDRCIFWSDTCDGDDPCPLHDMWKPLKSQISERMATTSLAEVGAGSLLD